MLKPGSRWSARAPNSVDLSQEGLKINNVLLIQRHGQFYSPVILQKKADDLLVKKITKISTLLNAQRIYDAIIYASTSQWPCLQRFSEVVIKANFNETEQRDFHGRWSKDGDADMGFDANISDIGYNGYLHDAVVDDLVRAFGKVGAKAEKNILLIGVPGVRSIPDLIVLPVGAKTPIIIEVKTGGDPPFTANQQYVYPLLCIGGHVSSLDPRVASLGLPINQPFPPLEVHTFVTAGPGKPVYPLDLCAILGLRKP